MIRPLETDQEKHHFYHNSIFCVAYWSESYIHMIESAFKCILFLCYVNLKMLGTN